MPSVAETIRRLQHSRAVPPFGSAPPETGRLNRLSEFGANPGALDAWCYVPRDVPGMALVVVLHGCTQTAAGYDRGSGWSALAERNGFAVLLPEQRRENNANLCFNWFNPEDVRRGGREVE